MYGFLYTEGANCWGRLWCAACNSFNRTCSMSTLFICPVEYFHGSPETKHRFGQIIILLYGPSQYGRNNTITHAEKVASICIVALYDTCFDAVFGCCCCCHRYVATELPLRYRKLVAKPSRCYKIVAGLWAAALVTYIAPLPTKPDWIYYRYNVNQKMCGLHWEYPL